MCIYRACLESESTVQVVRLECCLTHAASLSMRSPVFSQVIWTFLLFGAAKTFSFCRHLKNSKELECVRTIKLDDSVVTRIVCGPGERQAVVAAVDSIHTILLGDDGTLEGKSLASFLSQPLYSRLSRVGKQDSLGPKTPSH